jgi:hypothetical protein
MLADPFKNWNVTKSSWTFLTKRFDMYINDHSNSETKGMLIIDTNTRAVNPEISNRIFDLIWHGSSVYTYRLLFEEPLFVPSYSRNLL